MKSCTRTKYLILALSFIIALVCAAFITSISYMQTQAFGDEVYKDAIESTSIESLSTAVDGSKGATASHANSKVKPEAGSSSSKTVSLSKSKAVISEGTYTISSKLNSRMVQTTSGKSFIGMAKKSKTAKQKWYISKATGSNCFRIQSVATGRFLCAPSDRVIQARHSSNPDQIWRASSRSGSIALQNKSTGKMLTVRGDTFLTVADSDDSSNQLFKLSQSSILAKGTYYIQLKSAKRVLGVTGNLTGVGSNVALLGKSSNGNKKWTAVINKDGSYTFRNTNSARVLSVRKSAKKGANIFQNALSPSKYKKWRLTLNKNGDINISSAANGKSLVGVSSTKAGSNVKIVRSATSKGSIFVFKKARKPALRAKMERRIKNLSSNTKWMVVANTRSCFVGIYTGKKGNWTPYAYFPCTPGAYSSPSKKGIYKIGSKGYAFGTSSYTCYYFSQYSGNYLFHSILYNAGTHVVQDARMGIHASHGCIRLQLVNAKWINQNIPKGSTVYVY